MFRAAAKGLRDTWRVALLQVFQYCANPELCSMLAGSDLLTLGNLILELRSILEPQVQQAGSRVRSGINGEFLGSISCNRR